MTIEHELTRVELLQADDPSKYLLKDRREIAAVLRRLLDARELVRARGMPGDDSFLTALLQIDEGDSVLVLDGSPDESINARLGRTTQLDCVTQLDKVRIQFVLERPMLQTWRSGAAFRAALPAELLRLQRREFYRLQAPATHALTCSVPLPGAGEIAWRIIDISGGGIAIAVPPNDASFAPGDEFAGCRIKLPDSPPIHARLTVRNLFRLTTRNGIGMLRAGCEFSDMPPGADEAIQRYILKTERQRSARQRALG